MKLRIALLTILALALTACSAITPVGYCPTDGLFYWRWNGSLRSDTPAQIIAWGYDPYAYGNWCPGGSPTNTPIPPTSTSTPLPPTPTDTAVPPSPTDTAVPPTPTDTSVPPTPTNTAVPPSPTATNTAIPPTATATSTSIPPTPTPTLEPEPEPEPLFKMWLLESWNDWNLRHCLIISETHPSIERQNALCFPWIDRDHPWQAHNAPCAAYVYDDDTWYCDKYTPHRLPLDQLMEVWKRHLSKLEGK